MSNIAVGEHILIGLGAIKNIQDAKRTKDTARLFRNKQTLNKILRDLREYNFDPLSFVEQAVWKPKYNILLQKVFAIHHTVTLNHLSKKLGTTASTAR